VLITVASSHVFVIFPNNDNLQSGVRRSVRTIPKNWFAASITVHWPQCEVVDCAEVWYAAVIISQHVFQVSLDHFWMTLVLTAVI
jgi:hypothetical protein